MSASSCGSSPIATLSGINDANWLIHFRGAAGGGRHVSGCHIRGLCRGVQVLSQRRPKEIALAETEAKQKRERCCDPQEYPLVHVRSH